MSKNRYIGEYPALGIRPIVDGRRGPVQLRESLEGQVKKVSMTKPISKRLLLGQRNTAKRAETIILNQLSY